MTTQPEPPKPITRLAEPADRPRQRYDNRLGQRAASMAAYSLIVAILTVNLPRSLAWTEPRSVWILFAVLFGLVSTATFGVAVAAVVAGIVALVRAANYYMGRSGAIWALVLGSAAIAATLWAWRWALP